MHTVLFSLWMTRQYETEGYFVGPDETRGAHDKAAVFDDLG